MGRLTRANNPRASTIAIRPPITVGTTMATMWPVLLPVLLMTMGVGALAALVT